MAGQLRYFRVTSGHVLAAAVRDGEVDELPASGGEYCALYGFLDGCKVLGQLYLDSLELGNYSVGEHLQQLLTLRLTPHGL